MSLRSRGGRSGSDRESGQVPIAMIVLVFFGLLFVIFQFGLPLGQAADQKARSRASADAAALAAAEQVKEDLPGAIDDALGRVRDRDDLRELLSFLGGGFGREGAVEFASLNGGDVTSYTYRQRDGEIDVTVRGRADTSGQRSVSQARAKLGLRLGDCLLEDDEPEATTAPPDLDDPPAEDDEKDPPDVGTELRCGDLVLHFTINGENGRPSLDSSLDDVKDQFDIALTG